MTLVREDLVDTNCVLLGQTATLYTAIGQPFNAKLAIVDLETPYYKGYHTVGLVPNLAAEALLGMDVMTKQHTCALAVTRAQSKKYKKSEEEAHIAAEKCGVQPTNISRIEENEQDRIVDSSDEETDMEEDVNIENISNVNAETLSEMQKADNSINTLPEKILNQKSHENVAFFWENNILKRKWKSKNGIKSGTQVVLPKQLRKTVLELAHDRPLAGHLGLEKTKQRILSSFYWPELFSDVKKHCQTYDICQKTAKRTNQKVPMVTTPIINEPFTKIAMDIVGPLNRTKSGKKYILTIIDHSTRYPEAFALKEIDAKSVASALIEIFSRVGLPKIILTDQGSNFKSQLLKELYEMVNIQGITTSPYTPQSNGCQCTKLSKII